MLVQHTQYFLKSLEHLGVPDFFVFSSLFLTENLW